VLDQEKGTAEWLCPPVELEFQRHSYLISIVRTGIERKEIRRGVGSTRLAILIRLLQVIGVCQKFILQGGAGM
jgi:hypothetical protein